MQSEKEAEEDYHQRMLQKVQEQDQMEKLKEQFRKKQHQDFKNNLLL